MTDSEIIISPVGVVYSGADAVTFFAAKNLKICISLYMKTGIIPTRGVTISKMLKLAHRYTGKTYKNGVVGWSACVADLDVWCNTMRAALPITTQE